LTKLSYSPAILNESLLSKIVDTMNPWYKLKMASLGLTIGNSQFSRNALRGLEELAESESSYDWIKAIQLLAEYCATKDDECLNRRKLYEIKSFLLNLQNKKDVDFHVSFIDLILRLHASYSTTMSDNNALEIAQSELRELSRSFVYLGTTSPMIDSHSLNILAFYSFLSNNLASSIDQLSGLSFDISRNDHRGPYQELEAKISSVAKTVSSLDEVNFCSL
jgi:hypothetical protein